MDAVNETLLNVANETLKNATNGNALDNIPLEGKLLSSFVLFFMAIIPIYIGSHISLKSYLKGGDFVPKIYIDYATTCAFSVSGVISLFRVLNKKLAMLGLGDIVIPGVFVAMLLRFDHKLNRNGSKAYFYSGFIAYILGLLTTFIVMHVFKHAQPALLYLSPACTGIPALYAFIKGDFKHMLDYTDKKPEASEDNDSKEVKKQK